jgi:hypothetical protein
MAERGIVPVLSLKKSYQQHYKPQDHSSTNPTDQSQYSLWREMAQ